MELYLRILNGKRRGEKILLSDAYSSLQRSTPWILEDEAVEIQFSSDKSYHLATIELYNHQINNTNYEFDEASGITTFTWSPKKSSYGVAKLFHNYFGMSELVILCKDENENIIDLIKFQPIQVVAKNSTAENVEKMFEYLSNISTDAIHSAFSATKHNIGLNEGNLSPSHTLEHLENSTKLIIEFLPNIVNKPITRLIPEQKILPPTGSEEIDDSSIGWLLENLSVLEVCDTPYSAHFFHNEDYYKATSLRVPVLTENTDVYENWVLHGFIDLLIRKAQEFSAKHNFDFLKNSIQEIPVGYTSFFEKVSKFKSHLLGAQKLKIDSIIESLKNIKIHLDRSTPVTRVLNRRPTFTHRAKNNHAYFNIFIDIIKWHEKGSVDWSAYENLLAIQSIPELFETYCYFRVVESVNKYFIGQASTSHQNKDLITIFTRNNINLKIEREPNYWTMKHKSSIKRDIVNSEEFTIRGKDQYYTRGHAGPNSRRAPDIVLDIFDNRNDTRKLLILDAKYTSKNKAFIKYLPELTMKYVHGIHHKAQRSPTVTSLTILYTNEDISETSSFNHGDMGVFGSNPVTPSLQTLGLILGDSRSSDRLDMLIKRLLDLNNFSKNTKQIEKLNIEVF